MTPDEAKSAMRRGIDEVFRKGNFDVMDEIYAPHCSFHDPTFPTQGVAGNKEFARELKAAIPDLHIDVHDVLMDGDMTAARWTMAGTFRGSFHGIRAPGKSYVITGMTFNKWEGDRIVEEWAVYDSLGMLQQLGIIPETAEMAGATG